LNIINIPFFLVFVKGFGQQNTGRGSAPGTVQGEMLITRPRIFTMPLFLAFVKRVAENLVGLLGPLGGAFCGPFGEGFFVGLWRVLFVGLLESAFCEPFGLELFGCLRGLIWRVVGE
jgi:hypothetical protein